MEAKDPSIEPFKVCIRIRPFLPKELLQLEAKSSLSASSPQSDFDLNKHRIFKSEDNLLFVLDPALGFSTNNEKTYIFDTIFTEEHSNYDVFSTSMRPIISNVLSGYNSTALAYGVTGTGKTHTIFGEISVKGFGESGVILHSSDFLFEKLKEREKEITSKVTVSYLEIYNETVIDLLTDKQKPLMIVEDSVKGVVVPDLNEYDVNCSSDLIKLIVEGNDRRTMAPTNQNQFSSRSHAILQLSLEQRSKTRGIKDQVLYSKFLIVDLAGSERGGLEKGLRREEGANINKSLLSLGNCINLLSDKTKKGAFIPYRDSKLTRLLKDSLGGNILTVMIACVSPAPMTYEESINTLNYATRARKIQKKINRNVKEVSSHISQYKDIIKSLQSEVAQLKEIIKSQEIKLTEKMLTDEEDVGVAGELSEILPILNPIAQNDRLTSNNTSFISNKSANNSMFTSTKPNKNAQSVDVNVYQAFLNEDKGAEANDLNELQHQVETLKNDKVVLETFMSSKQYFYNSNNNNHNRSIDEKYSTIKAYYDKYIELINDKLIENIEQNMILKFNLKEIDELNYSNEQNIQLLQRQIDLLTQAKAEGNEVDAEGIDGDITKLNEEISNIQCALGENELLKAQLTESFGRNLKMKKMLKKILLSLLSSCSDNKVNDAEKYKEMMKEKNELLVNSKAIEGRLKNALSEKSKKDEMLLYTNKEIELLKKRIKEKDKHINELEKRNSFIYTSNEGNSNQPLMKLPNTQIEPLENILRHKKSTPQLKTFSINPIDKYSNSIVNHSNISIQPITTKAKNSSKMAKPNLKEASRLQNIKYIINQTNTIVNNNIGKVAQQPNSKAADNKRLNPNQLNNESNYSLRRQTYQISKGIQEFESLIKKTTAGKPHNKPAELTVVTPQITTQAIQTIPNITLSISQFSYNNEIDTKSDTDDIVSNRKYGRYLTHKGNQLEQARLNNRIKKEETSSVSSVVSSKAEDFIKEYTKKRMSEGGNKVDEAINSLVNIGNESNDESNTIINNEEESQSIIDNDNDNSHNLHESLIKSLCESIKDRKLSKYLTTNPS